VRVLAAIVVVGAVAACSRTPTNGKVELVDANPKGDVAPLVKAELATARSAQRTLLVYVGASWCEPCRRFHDAAASGALDDRFGNLRLLVFDADRDGERLMASGYGMSMIPMFAIPRDDGSPSGRQIEGGIKGDGAVAEIAPRLRALLDGKPGQLR
jgi:thiol-disulfide isomerase/thioredoxin